MRFGLSDIKEFVHFGLTSQDINNTSIPYSLKVSTDEVVLPMMQQVVDIIATKADEYKDISLLARTHGQPHHQQDWAKNFMFLWQGYKNNSTNST